MINIKLLTSLLFILPSISLFAQPVSTYLPSLLETKTIEIIDSTLIHNPSTILIAHGLTGQRGEQNHYWIQNLKLIPAKDFQIIKNHPSPVIRYYAYAHILGKGESISKRKFIIDHLGDNEIVRMTNGCTGGGTATPIHFAYQNSIIDKKDKELIAKKILSDSLVKASEFIQFNINNTALRQLTINESNYSIFKTYAKKNQEVAIEKLLKYKRKSDELFFIDLIQSALKTNALSNVNFRIIQYAIKTNFPRNSLDTLVAYHNQMKLENKLEEIYWKSKDIYRLIVKSNHPERAEILRDLAEVIDYSNKNFRNYLRSIIGKHKGRDLIEFRIFVLEKYGILIDNSLNKMNVHSPERTFSAVMKTMNALEKDDCKYSIDFRFLLGYITKRGLSAEKYINWALQSNECIDPYSILDDVKDKPFPSSKIHLFNLMKGSDFSEMNQAHFVYLTFLRTLTAYTLSKKEKKELKKWSQKVEKNFTDIKNTHRLSMIEKYKGILGI